MNAQVVAIGSDIQTIIWDLDGTLLDSFGIYSECLNKVLSQHNMPIAQEAVLRQNHHGTIEDSIANILNDMRQHVSEQELAGIIRDFLELDNAYIKDVASSL